jgi:mono/diheme cytochrome c family protein
MIEGVRPSGVPVAPIMLFPFYKILTPRDLKAVVAYTRSVAPIRNEVPGPSYRQPIRPELVPGREKPFTDDDLKDKVKRGFYLGTIAHCMECHARGPDGRQDFINGWGKGGLEMRGPFGKVTVSNITSHPSKGIGRWTDAEIRKSMTQDVGRDGRVFKQPMARGVYFSKMTDDDIDALVAWVRTLPPLE